MKKGACKLCLQEKLLCRESHIIPRFLYKMLAGKNNSLVFITERNARTRYNSEYESNILCTDCDTGTIGRLDDYAAKFIYGKFPRDAAAQLTIIDGREHVIIKNHPYYDYARYKLFLLSMLWRASISSRPFFSKVKLSHSAEEELRTMINNGEPGEPEEYPCFIHLPPLVSAPGGGRGFSTFYMPTMAPELVKDDKYEFCKFVIQGMTHFFVISRPADSNVEPAITGDQIALVIATEEEQSELHLMMIEMMRKHKR